MNENMDDGWLQFWGFLLSFFGAHFGGLKLPQIAPNTPKLHLYFLNHPNRHRSPQIAPPNSPNWAKNEILLQGFPFINTSNPPYNGIQ